MMHEAYPRKGGGPVPISDLDPRGDAQDNQTTAAFPGVRRGLDATALPKPHQPAYRIAVTAALLLLAACDPFQPDNVQAVIVTPEGQCTNLGGTPATHPAKDGTPWKVCTFRDTRICDLNKLRVDNRCYTTIPDTAPGN